MKNNLLVVSFIFALIITAKAQTPPKLVWHNNIEKAIQKATQENKETLVYFSGSDWCKPCIELKKEVFNSIDFQKKVAKKYILVNIDFPKNRKKLNTNTLQYIEQCAEKYNKKGAFPLVLTLNQQGKITTSINGYKSESAHYYVEKYL